MTYRAPVKDIAFSLSAVAGIDAVADTGAFPHYDADLMGDAASTGDVLTYGMGPQAQRFSTLNQINTDTVSKLVPAFASSLGGEKQRGQETQPLIHDGMMYVTASYSRLYAVDLAKPGAVTRLSEPGWWHGATANRDASRMIVTRSSPDQPPQVSRTISSVGTRSERPAAAPP